MNRITATLGGTTRPGVNGIAPKLDNGDLGPNTKPKRLPGAPPKPLERELTEFDVNGALESLRVKERAGDDVGPVDISEGKWTPVEVVMLIDMNGRGNGIRAIAEKLGREEHSVRQKLSAIRKAVFPHTKAEAGAQGWKNKKAKA